MFGLKARRVYMVAGALAGLALLSGGAVVGVGAVKGFAQGSAVINACANKMTGDLRVVKPGGRCLRNEVALNWNQQGPQGPAGGISITRRTVHDTLPVHEIGTVESACEADEVVTGGGYSLGSIGFNDKLFVNGPSDDRTWAVSVHNDTDYEIDLWVTAICAKGEAATLPAE